MLRAFDVRDLPPPAPGGAVTSIGVFDGLHLGHREILARNLARARELGACPTVVTFGNHPKGLLLGRAPRTLTSLEHRLELFRRAGIGQALVLGFDERLREMSAERFVDELLIGALHTRSFVLGFDSKFGAQRRGTPEFLRARGCDVDVVPEVLVDGRAVSSTAIREAVELGDLSGAERMLGRRVTILGEVVHGDARGRELGFPTANLDLHHELHPPPGVYACRVRSGECFASPPLAGMEFSGVANIGVRPTFGATSETRVEVHLLDFSGDLYGARLEVEFVARLRGERRFGGVEELRGAIISDLAQAKAVLAGAGL